MASGEQQHQEALVAGESPDRSERERSSGETTEGGGVVARPEETAENERLSGAGASVPAPAPPAGDEASGDTGTSEAPDDASSGTPERPEGESGEPPESGDSELPESGDSEDEAGPGEQEGKDARDARLKSAVAAWVAAEEAPEAGSDDAPDAPAPEADASGDSDSDGDEGAGSDLPVRPKRAKQATKRAQQSRQAKRERAAEQDDKSGSRAEKTGKTGKTGKPDKGSKADSSDKSAAEPDGRSRSAKKPAAEKAPAGDAPTAMFGILRRDEDGAADDGGEAAAERAERLTSAFFGSPKGGTKGGTKGGEGAKGADAESADAKGADAESAGTKDAAVGEAESADAKGADAKADTTDKSGTAAAPTDANPVDQPTATFRTKGTDRGKGAGSGKGANGGKGAKKVERDKTGATGTQGVQGDVKGEGDAKGSAEPGGGAGKPAVDQPTAVFRSPSAQKGSEGGKSPEKGAKDTKGDEGAEGVAGAWASQPATVPEAGPGSKSESTPASGSGSGSKSESGSEAGSEAGSVPKADPRVRGAGEPEVERTSQFVPLKSTDEPRGPAKPLPPAQATGAVSAASPVPPMPSERPQVGAAAGGVGSGAGAGAASMGASAAPDAAEQAGVEVPGQQPVPDPPPLDLLAQLTNTPPKAETPLRTLTRRVKIWTPLALLLVVVFVVVQAVRPLPSPELAMTASGTYAFKGAEPSVPWPSEGQAVLEVDGLGSLGSYGKEKPVPIASVAKVMTAYVILRDHPVKKGSTGAKIPVDQKAEDEAGLSAQNESTVEVKAGQKITQREAMNAIMIASANNVARLLARWDAGSEDAFVKKMNEAAKDLGMTNSTYTDPSGLKAETVSTAADQVKLGKKVMEEPMFREVVRQPDYEDAQGKTQPNWNKLVPVDGVVGIKTGTTTRAGGNLLFAAEKEIGGTKQLIVGAVLGQYKPSILDTVLAESKKLIDTAQDAMETRKVVRKGDVVGHVDDQLGGTTPVVATKDVTAVGWPGLKVKLGLTDKGRSIPHEAKPGTRVGTLTVGDGPGQVQVPVALKESTTEPGFGSKLTRLG